MNNNLWPHQARGIDQLQTAIDAGHRRICLTSPTGGGKTRVMSHLIEWVATMDWPVALYTHRRMLLDQTAQVLEDAGVSFGFRAADKEYSPHEPVQLCMTQSEHRKVFKKFERTLHPARLVLIDEAHDLKATEASDIISGHVDAGAHAIGFTGTPVGIGHVYDELIVAGTNSELRQCGALVPCQVFGPNEMDTRKLKQQKNGEFYATELKKLFVPRVIFGYVRDGITSNNPDLRPGLLFAPGIAESKWLCDLLNNAGIAAAHIDGKCIYRNNKEWKSTPEQRAELRAQSESGEIKYVCNRFVLREGVDWPHIYHCVTATAFGSIVSFLQSLGRVLRSHCSLDHVVWTDHGGNWHRHGSPNADRLWQLEDTAVKISNKRVLDFKEEREVEPRACPRCGAITRDARVCWRCNEVLVKRVRKIIQLKGTLKELEGRVYVHPPTKLSPDTQKKWNNIYIPSSRSKNGDRARNFNQLYAAFYLDHHYYPPRDLANMPIDADDWGWKARDLSPDRLIKPKSPAEKESNRGMAANWNELDASEAPF